MSLDLIVLCTLLLLAFALYHFFRSGDELPTLLVIFFYMTGINRYNVVLAGKSKWAFVKYSYITFQFNDQLAMQALSYFFLGTAIFFISYMLFHRQKYYVEPRFGENQDLFNAFILEKRMLVIGLFVFFTMINAYTKIVMSGLQTFAYGFGYFYLFSLASGGLILLFFLLYKNLHVENSGSKILYLGLFVFSAYTSYNPYMRFQFLSWMIALGVLIVKDIPIIRKASIYAIGGASILIFFSFAGNERHASVRNLDFWGKIEFAIERVSIAEDQNMLDGFMMVLQVYPDLLDYGYGTEHFEILLRPIPRALWPGKPVGGYANKLKLNEGMKGSTVGISQSIYGTFYGEGGLAGVILLSFLYGILFIKLFSYADQYSSDAKYLIKGIVLASLVPILRGGDLPGIIAFIGMSYWPIFLFLFLYRRFLKKKEIERLEILEVSVK
jgi:hypothetical protein